MLVPPGRNRAGCDLGTLGRKRQSRKASWQLSALACVPPFMESTEAQSGRMYSNLGPLYAEKKVQELSRLKL